MAGPETGQRSAGGVAASGNLPHCCSVPSAFAVWCSPGNTTHAHNQQFTQPLQGLWVAACCVPAANKLLRDGHIAPPPPSFPPHCMARHDVGSLVAEDVGQLGLIIKQLEQACVDHHLAPCRAQTRQ